MAFGNIFCLIKTTQYEKMRPQTRRAIPAATRKALRSEYREHQRFLQKVKSFLEQQRVTYARRILPRHFHSHFDLIITIGGDGTFLEAAQAFPNIPLLGCNSNRHADTKEGSIGALTTIDSRNISQRIPSLFAGNYSLSRWPLLQVRIKGKLLPNVAVNDIFIGNRKAYKSSDISIIYQGKEERFNCSGVIISTAVGSTAWYRNAGGKQFQTGMAFLVREPNSDRRPGFTKGALSPGEKIVIVPNSQSYLLSFDSRNPPVPLKPQQAVEIELRKKTLSIIHF